MNTCSKCGMPGGAWITHACGVGGWQFSTPAPNPSNTMSALTAEQWQKAWMEAVKVVVAARRFIDAEKDGNRDLIFDAHTGLLRALADYGAAASVEGTPQ